MILKNKNFSLLAVYFTYFVDNLSWAIVFPIFAPYFLDLNNVLFSPEISSGTRSMILGFFIMAFSLGQFIGAPLIGEYGDRHGRKKAFAFSVFFATIGLSLTAWSMDRNDLIFLFLGRLMTGLFSSSTSLCLSSISDLSESQRAKVKDFGSLSMIAGIAFVIGAFIGGKLADPTLSSIFDPSVPIWLAAALSFLNFLFILFGFRETSHSYPGGQFYFFESFRHIKMALRSETIKGIYALFFLFLFSWTIFFQFVPVLTVERYDFTSSNIGDLALYMGICWAFGSGYLNRYLSHRFPAKKILEACLISFTLLSALIVVPKDIVSVLLILGVSITIGGLAWPICNGLISNTAPQSIQGKILGISQSIQSFAMASGPLVGGLAFNYSLDLPFLIAANTLLFASLLYYFVLKHR